MANYTEPGYDPSKHGYWKGTIDGASNFGYPKNYFYADTIRSIMLGFGNYFNDLKVIRYNNFGEPVKIIDVPIKYGPRQKSHDFRVEQESGETYYISLPNMTYKIDGISFDANRASGIYEQRAFYNDELERAGIEYDLAEQYWSDVQPVPYNITISMAVNCEKMSDVNQIMEQILPRFAPAAFFNIKEFWWFNKRRSIKMKLNSPGIQIDSDQMGEEDRRIVTATFTFEIECMLYKPVKSAPIIECIHTYLTTQNTDVVWHNATFGNENGSLDKEYNFSKIYDSGVMNQYVLKDGYPKTDYNKETSAYITTYEYSASDNLIAYDANSKLIKSVSSRWISPDKYELIPTDIFDSVKSEIRRKVPIRHPAFSGDPILTWDNNLNMYRYDGERYTGEAQMAWSDVSGCYVITGYGPRGGEWYTEKEYFYPAPSANTLTDDSVTFGHKVLYDKNKEPYSAYYSQYSEEGTYSETSGAYVEGKKKYQYSAWNGDIIFSGGRYPTNLKNI